jgi:hypothetical protein
MNNLLTKALLASMFFALATGTTAFAQLFEGAGIQANIPFRFYAGDTWLPAGKYTIRMPNATAPDLLLIRNANDPVESYLVTDSTTRAMAASKSSLDFDRLGNKYFLSKIWVEGHRTGFRLEPPSLEKKMEQGTMKKDVQSVNMQRAKS